MCTATPASYPILFRNTSSPQMFSFWVHEPVRHTHKMHTAVVPLHGTFCTVAWFADPTLYHSSHLSGSGSVLFHIYLVLGSETLDPLDVVTFVESRASLVFLGQEDMVVVIPCPSASYCLVVGFHNVTTIIDSSLRASADDWLRNNGCRHK